MRNPFKQDGQQEETEELVNEQAVILGLVFGDTPESPKTKLQKIYDLEDTLEEALTDIADVDGHDFSSEDASIYIYGDSADTIWEHIEEFVKQLNFAHVNVKLRYGAATDDSAKEQDIKIK